MIFEQFDIVRITSTSRIKYLSGPPKTTVSPLGEWSVVGAIEGELLIAKDDTLVRVPLDDVQKVGRYDYKGFRDKLAKAGMPEPPKIGVEDGKEKEK